ncbi:hypothetical protein [Rathayibacter festucae]|uniref:hypothetical protein n=1 Tax=Rathayibacter festucae TaxID=110937 RepID=UPI002A6B725E|nr:hypothetical protein [Rathayibacter festucae]MDY0914520.1 hypothetical protein [Rathayibacter festucae]
MHLTRTHQNRWIARLPRSHATTGIITWINPGETPAVFRTEARTPFTDERRLLQDSDTLEIAFARIIAAHARSTTHGPTSFNADSADEAEQAA